MVSLPSVTSLTTRRRTFIMGVATIFVVLFHSPYRDIPLLKWFHNFGWWGVDIFLFVGGFGCVYSLRKNVVRRFYRNRLVRLLPACLLVGVAKTVFHLATGMGRLDEGVWPALISFDMWYIPTVLAIYFLCPFLYRAMGSGGRAADVAMTVTALSMAITQVPLPEGYFTEFMLGTVARLPVFVWGMVFALDDRTLSWRRHGLGAVVLVLCYCLFHTMFRPNGTNFFVYPLLALGIPTFVTAIALTGKVADKLRLTPAINLLGRQSLLIYLIHDFVYQCLAPVLKQYSAVPQIAKLALSLVVTGLLVVLFDLILKPVTARLSSRLAIKRNQK